MVADAALFGEDSVVRVMRLDQSFDVTFAGQVGLGDQVDASFVFDLKTARGVILKDRARLARRAYSKFEHFGEISAFRLFETSTDDTSREQRNHQLVMTRQMEATPGAAGDRPPNDVRHRAVMLNEVEVGRGEILERVAEVADDGQGFQKDFRQGHRRTDVQIYAAAVQLFDHRGEEKKVAVSPGADGRAVRVRVNMNDVGPDRDVNGDGDFQKVSRMQDRVIGVLGLHFDQGDRKSTRLNSSHLG